MILVDTSVWIDHFRRGNAKLSNLLNEGMVLSHPFVIGELACGNLRKRDTILNLLAALPQAKAAEHDEVMRLIGSCWPRVNLVVIKSLVERKSFFES